MNRSPGEPVLALTNLPTRELADTIAALAVEEGLAAAAQVVGPASSVYRWRGETRRAEEWQCVLKTSAGLLGRIEALVWSALGKAYYRCNDFDRSRSCFRESDTAAVYNDEKHPDVLFYNAFFEWKMAEREDNPTRAKIAFGRLKVLRSGLERRFPEVDVFDAYIEKGRSHA